MGCGCGRDSIEHYSRCAVVRRELATSINIQRDWYLPLWIGVDDAQTDENMVCLGAFGAYAAYRATNAARRVGGLPAAEGARALQQALRDAVAGHAPSERRLSNVWRRASAGGR